jgi:response regulator of citrate/malate metabolism
LQARSSLPRHLYRATPATVVARIEASRWQRWTAERGAAEVSVSPATVSRIFRWLVPNRLTPWSWPRRRPTC